MSQTQTTGSDENEGPWQLPKGRSWYLLLTLLSRGFFTITIAIFTSFGAQNLEAFGYAVLTGIALDALRNVVARNLIVSPDELREEILSAIASGQRCVNPMIFSAIMYVAISLYFFIIMAIGNK